MEAPDGLEMAYREFWGQTASLLSHFTCISFPHTKILCVLVYFSMTSLCFPVLWWEGWVVCCVRWTRRVEEDEVDVSEEIWITLSILWVWMS